MSLFAELAQRLEAHQREKKVAAAAEAKAKARARREAVAADPARAEQRKYTEERKAKAEQDKIQRSNILAQIADDSVRVKERAEQERAAREAS